MSPLARAETRRVPVDVPDPTFPAGPAIEREIIVESEDRYRLLRYRPPVELEPNRPRAEHAFDTPEATLLAFYSAQVAGDFEGFEACWTPASRDDNRAVHRRQGLTPDRFRQGWKQVYRGLRIELLSRLEMEPYILLHYRLEREGLPALERTSSFASAGGKWLLTKELDYHMVPHFWSAGARKEWRGLLPWARENGQRLPLDLPEPRYPTGPATNRRLVVERIYPFRQRRYTPAVELPSIPEEEARYERPEDALIAYLSAHRRGDARWLEECLESETRRVLAERRTGDEHAPDRQRFVRPLELGADRAGVRIDLVLRLEIESYAVFGLWIRGPGEPPFSGREEAWPELRLVVLTPETVRVRERVKVRDFAAGKATVKEKEVERERSYWRITHEVDGDPFLRAWYRAQKRIRAEELPPL